MRQRYKSTENTNGISLHAAFVDQQSVIYTFYSVYFIFF